MSIQVVLISVLVVGGAGLIIGLLLGVAGKKFAVEVDVSNTLDIYAKVNQVQVHLGTMDNMDQKVRTMAAVVATIPEKDRGTLDLSDLSKPIVFQYLL